MTLSDTITFVVAWCAAAAAFCQLLLRNQEFQRGGAWLSVAASDGTDGVDLEVQNSGPSVAVDMHIGLAGSSDGIGQNFWRDSLGVGRSIVLQTARSAEGALVEITFRDQIGRIYKSRRHLNRDSLGRYHLVDGTDLIQRRFRSGWHDRRSASRV